MMRFLIVGGGRMGSSVASKLSGSGHVVTVIDKDSSAVVRMRKLPQVKAVLGDALDQKVLIGAGIEQADGVAATTGDDELNLVVAQLALNVFQVPRVVARVFDPHKTAIYGQLGIAAVSPVAWGAEELTALLMDRHRSSILSFSDGTVSIVRVPPPPHLLGRGLAALAVPGSVQVVALERQGRTWLPEPETVIEPRDMLYVAVIAGSEARLQAMLSAEGLPATAGSRRGLASGEHAERGQPA